MGIDASARMRAAKTAAVSIETRPDDCEIGLEAHNEAVKNSQSPLKVEVKEVGSRNAAVQRLT